MQIYRFDGSAARPVDAFESAGVQIVPDRYRRCRYEA
jgi:hypothetical protein